VESGGMRVCLRGISVGEGAEWDLPGALRVGVGQVSAVAQETRRAKTCSAGGSTTAGCCVSLRVMRRSS
jgi:hypothetical protein